MEGRTCGLYRSDERILLVGDGDLSFALALARNFGSGEFLTATTFDEEHSLRLHYGPKVSDTIHELRERGARVFHGVDATKLDCYKAVLDGAPLPHKIVFMFPHPGWPKNGEGFRISGDGENCKVMIERHRALLRGFFSSSLRIAHRAACPKALELHVTHKTSKRGADWWGVVELGEECGFKLAGTLFPFDVQPYRLHGYSHKYGSIKKGSPTWSVNREFPLNFAATDMFKLP